MRETLSGITVALLVPDGFDEYEVAETRRALMNASARVALVGFSEGCVRSWAGDGPGCYFAIDLALDHASASEFDGLIVVGTVVNPDAMRHSETMTRFVREFFAAGKPVAAISQGLHGVLGADVLQQRTLTSFPSVRGELEDAGANWVDAAVVADHGLITSRSLADLDEFLRRLIAEFTRHARRRTRAERGIGCTRKRTWPPHH